MALGGGTTPRVSGTFPFSAGLPAQVIVVTDENGSVGAAVRGHEGVTLDQQDACLDTTRSFHCLRLHEADAVPIDVGELGWLTTTAQLLSCADTIGALRRAIEPSRDHLLERQAFGSSLASFQVIQHRLVDLEVLHASAQALVQRAAGAVEEKSDPPWSTPRTSSLPVVPFPHSKIASNFPAAWALRGSSPSITRLRRALTNGSMMRTRRASSDRLALSARLVMTKPTENDLEEYRRRVRRVIADHRPAGESREGHRAPTDTASEKDLRRWYKALYDEGVLGGAGRRNAAARRATVRTSTSSRPKS